MLVISLTSIPPRFSKLGSTLDCLLKQTAKVDRVMLHIPDSYRRFPEWDGHLPQVPEGIEIVRCDIDYGPATKVLPTAKTLRGQDVDILFCDDDRLYTDDWAQKFVDARADQPGAAIAPVAREAVELFGDSEQIRDHHPRAVRHPWQLDLPFIFGTLRFRLMSRFHDRAEQPSRKVIKRAGYNDLIMGLGGVMVRPEFFEDDAFDIPDDHWMVDDIWLSGMLAKNGVGIWTPANVLQPKLSPAHFEAGLVTSTISGMDRDTADRRCYEYLRKTYGIWR